MCNVAYSSEELRLSFNVDSRLANYSNLLESPSLIAMALQNTGISISSTMPISIVNNHKLKIGNAYLAFLDKNGHIYNYLVVLSLSVDGRSVPVEAFVKVDTENLKLGNISVSVKLENFNYVPDFVLTKIVSKANSIITESRTSTLIKYLDDKATTTSYYDSSSNLGAFENAIYIDAYNRSIVSSIGMNDNDIGSGFAFNILLICSTAIIVVLTLIVFFLIRKLRLSSI